MQAFSDLNTPLFSFRQIGTVRCGITESQYIPMQKLSEMVSCIDFVPCLTKSLNGIELYYSLYVLYVCDRLTTNDRQETVFPRGDQSAAQRGVLATRSPLRPNPIGMCHVIVDAIEIVEQTPPFVRLRVRGLDALNNSPVIDIKPALKKENSSLYVNSFV